MLEGRLDPRLFKPARERRPIQPWWERWKELTGTEVPEVLKTDTQVFRRNQKTCPALRRRS